MIPVPIPGSPLAEEMQKAAEENKKAGKWQTKTPLLDELNKATNPEDGEKK